jgi:MFS family permease
VTPKGSVVKAVSESLPTARWKGPHAVLSVCVGSYFAVRFAQVILGPIVPFLLETFGISRGAVGAALTGMWVAYALVQLPSGAASDRFGEARVVTAALVVTAVTSLGLAVAPTFVLFGLAAVGLGVGAGAYYNPATALIEREFDNVGGPVGAHRVGGQLAGVFGPVVAAAAAVGYGWRPVVAAAAVLPVAAASVFVLRFENAGATQEQKRQSVRLGDVFDHEAVLGALARKHTRTTTLMMTLVEFVGLATMAFLPTVLVEGFGFSVGRASLVFAVFFFSSPRCVSPSVVCSRTGSAVTRRLPHRPQQASLGTEASRQAVRLRSPLWGRSLRGLQRVRPPSSSRV